MWYVFKVQQEDFWRQDRACIELGLKLPKDGVFASHDVDLTTRLTASGFASPNVSRHSGVEQISPQAYCDYETIFDKDSTFTEPVDEEPCPEFLPKHYEFVRDLAEDRPKQIAVYRHILGHLVVCKTLNESGTIKNNVPRLPDEVVAYEKMSPHIRIVQCLGMNKIWLQSSENKAAYQLILEYCNGGDLDHLAEYGRERNQPLPEAFIWHMLKQTLEALVQTTLRYVEHLDVHPGNLFLRFDGEIERQYPDLVLGDFGICRFLTETQEPSYDKAIAELAYFFLDNIIQPVGRYSYESIIHTPQHSQILHQWLETISDGCREVTLQSLIQDLYPLIPGFIQQTSHPQLPGWMFEYFQNLQNLS